MCRHQRAQRTQQLSFGHIPLLCKESEFSHKSLNPQGQKQWPRVNEGLGFVQITTRGSFISAGLGQASPRTSECLPPPRPGLRWEVLGALHSCCPDAWSRNTLHPCGAPFLSREASAPHLSGHCETLKRHSGGQESDSPLRRPPQSRLPLSSHTLGDTPVRDCPSVVGRASDCHPPCRLPGLG